MERGTGGLSSPSTPLRAVSFFLGHLEVLKLLVARGADLGCKDRKGYGLLHTAAASGQLEVVKYLLRLGAEVRVPSTGRALRAGRWRPEPACGDVRVLGLWEWFGEVGRIRWDVMNGACRKE